MNITDLGLNEYLQPTSSPIASKQVQTQAIRFEQENILPTNLVDYTNMNPVARPYVAVVSLGREKGTFLDIQEAINYATSVGGGDVYFEEGSYTANKNLILQAGVRLTTNPNYGVLIDFADTYTLTCESNTTIENIILSNPVNVVVNDQSDIVFYNTSFQGVTATALTLTDSNGISIVKSTFNTCTIGISIIDSNRIVIDDCEFSGIDDVCISNDNNLSGSNLIITNNIASGGLSNDTFFRGDGTETVISNNIIGTTSDDDFAISIYPVGFSGVIDQTIIKNIIFAVDKAIFMGTANYASINGNSISLVGTAAEGIRFANCDRSTINGNTISAFSGTTDTSTAIILVTDSDQNAITGNFLEYGGAATSYTVNIGAGCDFNAVTGNAFNGGTADAGSNNVFSGNSG